MGLLGRLRGPGHVDRREAGSRSLPGETSSAGRARVPAWIADGRWRGWDPPLNLVAGESHHEEALRRIAGPPRQGGWLVPCEAELRREPDNRYDEAAIAVYIEGGKVGYVCADACGELAAAMDGGRWQRVARVPALVRGGWPDKPNLGVMLWLQRAEVRTGLRGVDWALMVERFPSRGWPPKPDEGVPVLAVVPSDTGRRRRRLASRRGREPRMPPLVDHYTAYVEDVGELKRRGRLEDAERLLLALVEACEEEARQEGLGVPPWYYEQLAIVRRKRLDFDGELEVLERFAAQLHAPGVGTPKLLKRLGDVRARRAQ